MDVAQQKVRPDAVLSDKAYDADDLLAKLEEAGGKAVIPLKSNRK